MKKILALLVVLLVWRAPLHATQIIVDDFSITLSDSTGTLSGPLVAELGEFAPGFDPTALNLNDWAANWIAPDATDPDFGPGFYDPTSPELAASVTQADNSVIGATDQLMLWVFDTQTVGTSQWALFTDPSWVLGPAGPTDFGPGTVDFTADSTALYGSLDFGRGVGSAASTAAVSAADPASWAAIMLCIAFVAISRRRFGEPVAVRLS